MITMTDLFCGAGGSSSGAVQAGVEVRMAANHWALAVQTHNTNHPATDHDCADISQVDPRRYPATDLLWASPECTNHSQARGHRRRDRQPDLFGESLPEQAAVRSRATMWDVLRFAEHHAYAGIVVENVVDVRDWVMWPAWALGLQSLGYEHTTIYLNSMHASAAGEPAPQSRDRLYVVAWRSGNPRPDLDRWTRPTATCPTCGHTSRAVQAWKNPRRRYGRYRTQYTWRCPTARCHAEVHPTVLPAATAIDWSLPGQRIGDRERPLAPKTMDRIQAGLHRYARPIDEPLKTIHTTASKALAYHPALLVPVEGRDGPAPRPVTVPARTQTTRLQDALIVPLRNNNTAKPAATWPLDTVAASGLHHALITPGTPLPAAHPWADPHQYAYDTGAITPVTAPWPTQTTVPGDALLDVAPAIEDCAFRMLTPTEIAAAMAFPGTYQVLGNRREQVRQAGNAVTPPAARDLLSAVVEALTGQDTGHA